MTNAEKFKDVFGFYPDVDACVLIAPCPDCKYYDADDITGKCQTHFWNEEYKE